MAIRKIILTRINQSKVKCLVPLKDAITSLTKVSVEDHYQLIMQLKCGAVETTLQPKVECVSVRVATESGRKRINLMTPIDSLSVFEYGCKKTTPTYGNTFCP